MFYKKAVLFYLRNSHVKTVMETYFSRSRPERPFLIKVFSCKFFEISQNISLTEHQWRAPSKAKKNTLVSGNAGVEKNLHPGGPQFFFLINLTHYSPVLLLVSGKLPPGKFSPIKLPPGKFPPRKFPHGIFPPEFLIFLFFSLLSPSSLIWLKRLFCNSTF